MINVLVDTSVWIDFFNPHSTDSEERQKLKSLIYDNKGNAVLCPVVYQEVLQGIREDKNFQEIKSLLAFFPMLEDDFPKVEDTAINLYRSLRKQGITIRKSNDCLIAAYALVNDLPVLFKDRDFEAMANHSALRKF